MSRLPIIQKASGEEQPFDPGKLKYSLQRSGADSHIIEEVANDIIHWIQPGTSTRQIYTRAFRLLRKKRRSMAARYSLKKAIMELGPSGYPFEQFVGHLFKCKGFDVQVGQVVNGKCVTHEVDVIASNHKNQHLVECKYHNSQGKFSSVQVPLYIRSRVNDIIETRKALPEYKDFTFHGWVVTNTRFTTDAMAFGKCSGLNLMSWDFPDNDSLKVLTEKHRAFPVTALTQLTKAQKQFLLKKGVVLCEELKENKELLHTLQISERKITGIIDEAKDLCDDH
ncbi:restriction endonuclease [Marinilabilia rubra]|uniref:ATP-binding protein n=1 Tax=Marinilabilia rubra TaxID=2162893 RepID=A0A2U2B4S2_9BACT|nr:restriction endonuclease [Marinilabilia rubra]PWD98059.1 ATP-binding protein [Marinilabilia rubra]